MLRAGKVATPLTAATVAVPDRVPPPGVAPMAMVTLWVAVVTVLPNRSRIATTTAGEIALVVMPLEGWIVKASRLAGPADTANWVLVAATRFGEAADRVYPVPALLMLSPGKVATPLAAATVVTPDRVPLPALVPIASETRLVALVMVFPAASWTATV